MNPLADVRKDVAAFSGDSGMCPEDPKVVEAINDARRLLYPLGDWKDTVESICVVSCCDRITLPWCYEYITRAFQSCQKLTIDNDWFSVIQSYGLYCGREYKRIFREPGNYVTFRDYPRAQDEGLTKCGDRSQFRVNVIAEDDRDIGKTLVFKGNSVHKHNVSLTRIITKEFESNLGGPTDEWVTQLNYVVKPQTVGRIRVYGHEGTKAVDTLLAVYDPDAINPSFTRYKIGQVQDRTQIIAKCKKKFVKLTDDTQPVDIATDALIDVLQAITARKSRDRGAYNTAISAALTFLRKELSGPESTSTHPIRMSNAYHVASLVQ